MEMKQEDIDENVYAPLFAVGKEWQIAGKAQPDGGRSDSKR